MDRTEKIICELFQVKSAGYVSRPMLIKAIVVMYDKINQVLLDLYCVKPRHAEFNGMDGETRARMEKGKKDLRTANNKKWWCLFKRKSVD